MCAGAGCRPWDPISICIACPAWIPRPPGIDCLLSCLPWSHFRVHLIFDNVPNPTAALSRDFRSANTNSARALPSLSYFKQLFPNFDLCCTLIQNFQGFLCWKTATELAQLPPTVTWAPGWPTGANCGRHTLMACQYPLTTCLLNELKELYTQSVTPCKIFLVTLKTLSICGVTVNKNHRPSYFGLRWSPQALR